MTSLGNKEIMAKNIQRYMRANGLSRKELAQKLNVPYTTITDWVKGNTYPRIDKIEALANFFGTDKAHLVEDPTAYPQPETEPKPKSARSALPPGAFPVPDLSGLKKIPILGSSACGLPIEAIRSYDYIQVNSALRADFALFAEGKSMTGAGIMDGSMVFFRETEAVNNGEIAAVTVDNSTMENKSEHRRDRIDYKWQSPLVRDYQRPRRNLRFFLKYLYIHLQIYPY